MSYFIKVILTCLVIYWLFKTVGRFFFTLFFMNKQHQNQQRPPKGNVQVDYIPKDAQQQKNFKGGEYVDYEEVE